jgi:ATP adenylyltransferase
MSDFNKNIWAPWRMEYIRSLGKELADEGCFFCRYWNDSQADRENRVVWRSESALAVLNRFPYTNGHLLVAQSAHKASLTDLTDAELMEVTLMTRTLVKALSKIINPAGFNIGYNMGQCAGAGLPGHLHGHIVPRWTGDTSFMAVLDDVRVVPDSLDAMYDALAKELKGQRLRS